MRERELFVDRTDIDDFPRPILLPKVTHHGLEISNNPVLIKSVNPRVAICNNGPRKARSCARIGPVSGRFSPRIT